MALLLFVEPACFVRDLVSLNEDINKHNADFEIYAAEGKRLLIILVLSVWFCILVFWENSLYTSMIAAKARKNYFKYLKSLIMIHGVPKMQYFTSLLNLWFLLHFLVILSSASKPPGVFSEKIKLVSLFFKSHSLQFHDFSLLFFIVALGSEWNFRCFFRFDSCRDWIWWRHFSFAHFIWDPPDELCDLSLEFRSWLQAISVQIVHGIFPQEKVQGVEVRWTRSPNVLRLQWKQTASEPLVKKVKSSPGSSGSSPSCSNYCFCLDSLDSAFFLGCVA